MSGKSTDSRWQGTLLLTKMAAAGCFTFWAGWALLSCEWRYTFFAYSQVDALDFLSRVVMGEPLDNEGGGHDASLFPAQIHWT